MNVRTLKFIEEVHDCPGVWDVSSVVYKDTFETRYFELSGELESSFKSLEC